MDYHVSVREVYKEFHGIVALKGVSFNVERGGFLAIIGPNGAGKTTLLRILDLLEEPTKGEVWLDGERVNYARRDLYLLRRRIGFVPQRPILFNASVFDNVAYGLKVRGLGATEVKERVERTLEIVQLNGFEKRNALKLSGGEAQRVSLAQALVTDPHLLLLDEPTVNLDQRSTSVIEETLIHLNRDKKMTIIMTSHDLSQVENVAHQIAILSGGRIVDVGGVEELLSKISSGVVKYMRLENVFTGVSTVTDQGTSIVDIGDGLRIEASFMKPGEVRIYIPPDSITVLAEKVKTSARNLFEGRIHQVTDYGHKIKLKIKVKDGREFSVEITKKSFEEMKLNLGSNILISFKASSVKLLQ